MSRLTRRFKNGVWKNLEENPAVSYKQICEKLAHYEDLEEAGGLMKWKKTSEEKPNSSRHLIVADGGIISHYGYYLKLKNKWFTNWKCEEEISEPMFWMDMPEPPKESLHSDCRA